METIGFANQTNIEIDWQKVGLAIDKTVGLRGQRSNQNTKKSVIRN
jgi:hypothetical protein